MYETKNPIASVSKHVPGIKANSSDPDLPYGRNTFGQ